MDAVMTVPAGWYADPLGDDVLRWWTGAGWSQHTGSDAVAPPDGVFDASGLGAPDPEAAVAWDLADVEECLRIAALWRDAAAAVREVRRTAVLHVAIDDLAPIVIDTRYRAYGWRYPLVGLPPAPAAVTVTVLPSAPLAPTVFTLRNGPVTDLLAAFERLAAVERLVVGRAAS